MTWRLCSTCGGSGRKIDPRQSICSDCQGSGQMLSQVILEGPDVDIKETLADPPPEQMI